MDRRRVRTATALLALLAITATTACATAAAPTSSTTPDAAPPAATSSAPAASATPSDAAPSAQAEPFALAGGAATIALPTTWEVSPVFEEPDHTMQALEAEGWADLEVLAGDAAAIESMVLAADGLEIREERPLDGGYAVVAGTVPSLDGAGLLPFVGVTTGDEPSLVLPLGGEGEAAAIHVARHFPFTDIDLGFADAAAADAYFARPEIVELLDVLATFELS